MPSSFRYTTCGDFTNGQASIPPEHLLKACLLMALFSVRGERQFVVDFRGERRSNDTHRSTTDPEASMARKGKGKEAKLCFGAHLLMDNREGLAVDVRLTPAGSASEREAAL